MKGLPLMMSLARAVVTVAVILALAPSGLADDPEDSIFAEWRKRKSEITSVELVAKGKGTIATAHEYPIELTVRVDFEKGRVWKTIRQDFVFLDKGGVGTHEVSWAYDGNQVIRVMEKDRNPHWPWTKDVPEAKREVLYLGERSANIVCDMSTYPWLLNLGVNRIPGQAITPRTFGETPTTDNYSFHGTAEVNGKKCVVLRTKPKVNADRNYSDFFVDTTRQCTVARYIHYLNGKRSAQFDVTVEERDGLWLPIAWTWASLNGQVDRKEEMKIARLTLNPKFETSHFTPEIGPGTIVAVRGGEEDSTQFIRRDGSRVDLDL